MRISDWSSDVCSSDLPLIGREPRPMNADYERAVQEHRTDLMYLGLRMVGLVEMMLRDDHLWIENVAVRPEDQGSGLGRRLLAHAERKAIEAGRAETRLLPNRSEEHTSELQSLMRISDAVFC